MTTPNEVLEYWLGEPREDGTCDPERARKWWEAGDHVDREIRERFGDVVAAAHRGELDDWARTPRGRAALIILIDQFSRNVYRGSAEAFAADGRAQRLTREAIESGEDAELAPMERYFVYMPLMHAEDLALQDLGVEMFGTAAEQAPTEALRKVLEEATDYARRHRVVVAKFGRFPHRNEVLGRESTDDEQAHLAAGKRF